MTVSVLVPFKATTSEHIEWLINAMKSVEKQTYEDWQMVIIDDHSTVDLTLLQHYFKTLPRDKVYARKNAGVGVSVARNTAARVATGELLMPLDADDELPENALELLMKGWESGGKDAGIVYGDMKLFGEDWAKMRAGVPYDYNTLLRRLMMPVGALHAKKSWEEVGGWKKEMEDGLEDWEYWIALGEIGICGHYLPGRITYHYRKHNKGRLAYLKEDTKRFDKQLAKMRDLHQDVYNGRFPVGCCGKSRSPAPVAPSSSPATTMRAASPSSGLVAIRYTGRRNASFFVTGRASRTKYKVNGRGSLLTTLDGQARVKAVDAPFILSLGGGRDFEQV
jgi:glycosyltransferase involved in cell wall biosynthesis